LRADIRSRASTGEPWAIFGDGHTPTLRSNTTRSVFAEYIVGLALGVVNKPRVEWDSVDLRYGDLKVEVKASGYCQSWFQKKPSSILSSIREAIFWNPETGMYEGEATRSADVYVFCVHAEQEKSKANVLDISTWQTVLTSIFA